MFIIHIKVNIMLLFTDSSEQIEERCSCICAKRFVMILTRQLSSKFGTLEIQKKNRNNNLRIEF